MIVKYLDILNQIQVKEAHLWEEIPQEYDWQISGYSLPDSGQENLIFKNFFWSVKLTLQKMFNNIIINNKSKISSNTGITIWS